MEINDNADLPKKPRGRPILYPRDSDRHEAIRSSKRKYYEANKEKYQEYYENRPKDKENYDRRYRFGGYFCITDGLSTKIQYSKSMYFRAQCILRQVKSDKSFPIQKKFSKECDWKITYLEYCDKGSNDLKDKWINEATSEGLTIIK